MAYTFTNTGFAWTKTGSDPTADERALGLQGGMALPAQFVNQQWTKTYKAIQEIQQVLHDMSQGGDKELKSIAIGTESTAGTENSAAIGNKVTSASGVVAVGRFNKTPTASTGTSTDGDVFVVGNGTVGSAKSNALRVTSTGDVMGTKAYTASGADICHLVEWIDGNPNNEDRRGLFITFDGDKIRLANKDDDYILGVISSTPSLICNACTDDWHGKYVTDEFGERIIENGAYKLSDEFDSEKDDNYISRLDRSEYGIVGHSGIVIARDDGTCKVNGYCMPGKNGIGTSSKTGYRVMSRVSENLVKLFVSAPIIINK